MKRIYFILLLTFINISIIPFGVHAEAISVTDYVLKISDSTSLEIINKNGSIQVNTWFRDYVKISIKKVSFSWEAKDELELVELKSKRDKKNDSLILETEYKIDIEKVYVYLDIRIPEKQRVKKIETANGKIRIEGSYGDLDLTTSFGKIEAIDINGNIRAITSSGMIILDSIEGSCIAETSNGVISVYSVNGDLALTNTNGKIDAVSVHGDIRAFINVGDILVSDSRGIHDLETSTGVIKVNNNKGDVRLLTSFGKIDVENVDGYVYAKNDNGKIIIENSKGILKAKTINGNIKAEVYNINEDGTSITTDNGSIKVGVSESVNAELEIVSAKNKIDTDELTDVRFKNISFGHKLGLLGIGGPKLLLRSRTGRIKVLWL